MRKFEEDVIDVAGNAISGATVDVYNAGTLVRATLYSDDGVTPIANPTSTNTAGTFKFYAKDGRYDITISGSGLTTRTRADEEIADVTEAIGTDSSTWKTGVILVGDGLVSAPGFGFTSAPTTGIFRVGGALTLGVSGVAYWKLDSTGAWFPNSSGSYDLGSVTNRVNNLYVNTIPAGATLTSPTINTPTISTPTITGVASLASATLSSTITNYNGIATVSSGVPAELATVDLTAQTAAITTTTLYAVTVAGQFRLSWNAKVTTAAGTSSTLGALTIVYTDPDGVAQTITAPASIAAGTIATTSTANTTAAVLLGLPLLLNCKAATNITYAMAYASNAANAMNYNLHMKLEALG